MRARAVPFLPCLGLAYGTAAVASPPNQVSINLCVNFQPTFVDATPQVGDDYVTAAATPIRAYGTWLDVKLAGASIWSGYLKDDGALAGCTPSFQVFPGTAYDVTLTSKLSVSGKAVEYRGPSGNLFTLAWSGVSFASAGTWSVSAGDSHVSRVLGAIGFALHRQDLGIPGVAQSVVVHRKADPNAIPCPGTSCNSQGEIYYMADPNPTGTDQTVFKSVLIHELGHTAMRWRIGDYPKDYSYAGASGVCPVDLAACAAQGTCGHQRDSVEYQSAALVEGFGNFFAAAVFNDTSGIGCGTYSKSPVDWNHNGVSTQAGPYDCEGAPVVEQPPLASADYLWNDCLGAPALFPSSGVANEYDYQRFFWDVVNKHGRSVGDVLSVLYGANNPTAWNAKDVPLGLPGAGDNIVPRLAASASGLGWGGAWSAETTANGVGY